MTFIEIYDRIIPLWGEKIDFSDGYILQPNQSYKNLRSTTDANDYFYSKNLSNQWNAIEETLAEEDVYGRLMVWTIFQVFQQYARKKFEQNILSFSPKEIDKKDIEEQYLKELKEEEWEDQ